MTKPKLLLIIGPTAVGKSSLMGRALREFPRLTEIISYTSRAMRTGEAEGDPYHFVTPERFREMIEMDFFLEWASVHDKYYGTPKDQVEAAAREGRIVCHDIDVQGAARMLEMFPEAVTIFLMPPSLDALRERFVKRGITTEADLVRRLESARVEIARRHEFGHVVVNDDLETAYAELKSIISKI